MHFGLLRASDMICVDSDSETVGAHSVYSDYGGIANEAWEGEKIARSLGENGKAAILMNHGLLTVGQTADEAAFLFCLMERSCKVQLLEQLLADAAGHEKRFVRDEKAAYNFKMGSTPDTLYVEFQPHYQYEEALANGSFNH
ncbi:class II aldolase/adducin N-terminal [Coniochaeta sp. 2T2.1]|nr:class II aldolase/adducin N-terminal [Coniochaeta sp. 2T2.1]